MVFDVSIHYHLVNTQFELAVGPPLSKSRFQLQVISTILLMLAEALMQSSTR